VKKVGILLKRKDYLLPYVSWLLENQKEINYKIIAIHTDDVEWAKQNIDFSQFVDFQSLIDGSDLVVSLSYWKKINEETIDKVPMGIINFHHSHKLKYKGRHASTWVIRNNEKRHGSTMHFIDKDLDRGIIIDTDCFEVKDDYTAQDVFVRSNETGLSLLKKNFGDVIQGNPLPRHEESMVTFTYRESDINHCLDIKDQERLLREIRSLTFQNCPAPYVVLEGKKVFLKMEGYDSGILEGENEC